MSTAFLRVFNGQHRKSRFENESKAKTSDMLDWKKNQHIDSLITQFVWDLLNHYMQRIVTEHRKKGKMSSSQNVTKWSFTKQHRGHLSSDHWSDRSLGNILWRRHLCLSFQNLFILFGYIVSGHWEIFFMFYRNIPFTPSLTLLLGRRN